MRGTAPGWWPRLVARLVLAILVLLSVYLVQVVLFKPGPVRVGLDLLSRRVAFTVGGSGPQEIFDGPAGFSALVVQGCTTITFRPQLLEAYPILPAPAPGEARSYPEPSFRVTPAGKVEMRCEDAIATVTLRGVGAMAGRLGALDSLRVEAGSEVVLAVRRGREIMVHLEAAAAQPLEVLIDRELELETRFVELVGEGLPPTPGPRVTYRAVPHENDRRLEITSAGRRLALVLTPALRQPAEALLPGVTNLPVAALNLLDETPDGKLVTPLCERAPHGHPPQQDSGAEVPLSAGGAGTLEYLDYRGVRQVAIEPQDYVVLGDLEGFRLDRLVFDTGASCWALDVRGSAGRLETGGEDRRLSRFQRYFGQENLWSQVAVGVLVGVLVGVILTLISACCRRFRPRPAPSVPGTSADVREDPK